MFLNTKNSIVIHIKYETVYVKAGNKKYLVSQSRKHGIVCEEKHCGREERQTYRSVFFKGE